eukprot:6195605-Amphidinium_carterae.1
MATMWTTIGVPAMRAAALGHAMMVVVCQGTKCGKMNGLWKRSEPTHLDKPRQPQAVDGPKRSTTTQTPFMICRPHDTVSRK